MRRIGLGTVVLSTALAAAPEMASQMGEDTTNACFDVAAPMAEATPCAESGHHKRPGRARKAQDKGKKGGAHTIRRIDDPASGVKPVASTSSS